jgi:hypothetical protein
VQQGWTYVAFLVHNNRPSPCRIRGVPRLRPHEVESGKRVYLLNKARPSSCTPGPFSALADCSQKIVIAANRGLPFAECQNGSMQTCASSVPATPG